MVTSLSSLNLPIILIEEAESKDSRINNIIIVKIDGTIIHPEKQIVKYIHSHKKSYKSRCIGSHISAVSNHMQSPTLEAQDLRGQHLAR